MSDHAALIKQMLAGREHWVDLAPGKKVKFRFRIGADDTGRAVDRKVDARIERRRGPADAGHRWRRSA